MRVCAAEAGLVPRRVRGQLSCPGAAPTGPMSDRAPHRRMLAPRKDRRHLPEPGQIDPAGGVEQNEKDPRPGPSRGGSPAPHRGLRAPAAAAIPRSAPRRVAGSGPILAPLTREPHRSGRARHEVSEDRGIADGQDRRQLVLKAVRRAPYRSNLERGGQARPNQGRSGPPVRDGRPSSPRPARFDKPKFDKPRSDKPRSDKPRFAKPGRPFPRAAGSAAPRPPSPEGADRSAKPRPNYDRPRPAGYVRPGGKPGPGGGAKGRSDRGPRPPFVPGSKPPKSGPPRSGPAKSWPRAGGSGAKPGKPSFRGRKPDRKKPGA